MTGSSEIACSRSVRSESGLDIPRVHLASRSPRRRQLLTELGIEHDADSPGVDDGQLVSPSIPPEQWVAALAYLKARAAIKSGGVRAPVVLGADTVVVKLQAPSSGDAGLARRTIIGQPRDVADARAILLALRNGEHDVLTGVALVDTRTGRRDLFVDRARVRVGGVTDAQIDSYLATGHWQGKAGGYNLSERLQDGWPIEYHGDSGTIMGLPTRMLKERVRAFSGAHSGMGDAQAV